MKKPLEYLDQISEDSLRSKLSPQEYLEFLQELRDELEIRIESAEFDADKP